MKKILFLACLAMCHKPADGQIKNIIIDSISGPNEPSIAIDPRNTSHIVAGSNTKNYYVSTDGGYHWYNDTLTSTYGVFGDPVIIADTTGAFYYFHLADNPTIHTWPMWADRIVAQRMDDISTGVWSNGGYTGYVPTPAIADKPGVCVDTRSNTIYVTWTKFDRYGSSAPTDSSNILFSKSSDRGNTWSRPVRINNIAGNCTDDDPTVEGATPCVGPNGEVFVGWVSEDGIMFDRSTDGGATWLASNVQVTSVPGGWNYMIPGLNRCNGLPYTACDISGSPHKGNIYINWTDQRNGINNTDVWICKSPDNGDTWSAPIKVNDDTGSAQQFLSSMAVDPATGYIYIVFYDRRNYTPDTNLTDVYLAVSKDGAETFQNFKISEKPFSPSQPRFFGDYTFISAFHNVVRPIWGSLSRLDSSWQQQILTAIIDTTITGTSSVTNMEPVSSSCRVYPNPFREQTTVSYELLSSCRVSVSLTDITGRTVAILEHDRLMPAGNYALKLRSSDYNLSQGLYFLSFRTGDFVQTQKLVLSK
jgi:hypothetical protein